MTEEIKREVECDFTAYIEKHEIRELFSNLMHQCFMAKAVDPRKFISNKLCDKNSDEEIKQLRERVSQLEGQLVELHSMVQILKTDLEVDKEGSNKVKCSNSSFQKFLIKHFSAKENKRTVE